MCTYVGVWNNLLIRGVSRYHKYAMENAGPQTQLKILLEQSWGLVVFISYVEICHYNVRFFNDRIQCVQFHARDIFYQMLR